MNNINIRKLAFIFTILLVVAVIVYFFIIPMKLLSKQYSISDGLVAGEHKIMNITSSAFKDGEMIPVKYTCEGDNISPPLSFSGVPENTKSIALIVSDVDSPSGVWVHWIIWNITPDITELNEGIVPAGAVEGETTFGENKYGGPCPGSGKHRYVFRAYALDSVLNLAKVAEAEYLKKSIQGHIIDAAEITGLYERINK